MCDEEKNAGNYVVALESGCVSAQTDKKHSEHITVWSNPVFRSPYSGPNCWNVSE